MSPQGSGASISANWWAGSLRSARPESTPSCDPGQCLHMKVNNMLRIIQFSIVFQIVLLNLLGMHLLNSANYNEMKKKTPQYLKKTLLENSHLKQFQQKGFNNLRLF